MHFIATFPQSKKSNGAKGFSLFLTGAATEGLFSHLPIIFTLMDVFYVLLDLAVYMFY